MEKIMVGNHITKFTATILFTLFGSFFQFWMITPFWQFLPKSDDTRLESYESQFLLNKAESSVVKVSKIFLSSPCTVSLFVNGKAGFISM